MEGYIQLVNVLKRGFICWIARVKKLTKVKWEWLIELVEYGKIKEERSSFKRENNGVILKSDQYSSKWSEYAL